MSRIQNERTCFCVYMCVLVKLVVSNPVHTFQSPLNSQFQASLSQCNPYNQNVAVQNPMPCQGSYDGSMINEILTSKIPSLQNILDPNTRHCCQNNHMQENIPSVVNNYFIVPPEFFNINNNTTASETRNLSKRKNSATRKHDSKRKSNQTLNKAKSNSHDNRDEIILPADVELITNPSNDGHVRKRDKKRKETKFARIVKEESELNIKEDEEKTEPEVIRVKKKKKNHTTSRNKRPKINTSEPLIDNSRLEVNKEESVSSTTQKSAPKRRRKSKKELNVNEETVDTIHNSEVVMTQGTVLPREKKVKSPHTNANPSSQSNLEKVSEQKKKTYLKNIEAPVDNQDSKVSNRSTKQLKENRKTRNPNTEKVSMEPTQNNVPASDDILKSMYPYMNAGNNFYNNGNYPFNFEQFYQSFLGAGNTKNTNERPRKNQSDQSKKKSPKVIEIKLKPKKKDLTSSTTESLKSNEEHITTSEKPLELEIPTTEEQVKSKQQEVTTSPKPQNKVTTTEESSKPQGQKTLSTNKPKNQEVITTEKPFISKKQEATTVEDQFTIESSEEDQPDSINIIETSTESAEPVLESPAKKQPIPPIKPRHIEETQSSEEEEVIPKPVPIKEKSVIPKANLKMPPTVIEDLHEYITPEVLRDDIVPTAHSNGVIKDYYPIFNDENLYLESFEDNRHFYTTDRGVEEHLNRERRKYDRSEHYSKLDFRNRINSKNTHIYRERDKPKHTEEHNIPYRKIPQHEKVEEIEDEFHQNRTKNHEVEEDIREEKFQTPPLLENPDFQTRKIERPSKHTNHESQDPVFLDLVENVPNFSIYADLKPVQYSRLTNYDADMSKDDTKTNLKPINDHIETVFAKTRVVKYGVANDDSDAVHSFQPMFDDEDKVYNDGHTTYVVAKSLGHAEDYFW